MQAPEFWSGRGARSKLLSTLLSPLGAGYGFSVALRQWGTSTFRPKARVVCVGNLTAGGSGKTPVAIALARLLIARGCRIVFLSRGYGGLLKGPVRVDPAKHSATEVGDEPLLLAAAAPTVVARDRAEGARLCDALAADIIVMDDGHQNFQLVKDVSLVVVNAAQGFGNGRLIPAGPLRESVTRGLARADAVILMGEGNPALPAFDGPVLRARAAPATCELLSGEPVFAFAGIANPERFFDSVRLAGAKLAGTRAFADHHPFTLLEISRLRQAAETLGARLITTEKDYVRLTPGNRDGIMPVPVTAIFGDESAIAPLLDRLCASRNNTPR